MEGSAGAAHAGSAGTPERGEETGGLRRAVSSRMLLAFIVGDMLGAGIYALVGEVGAEVGGAIWTSFGVALILAVLTAFAYAELVTKYPRAAGAALYTQRAFRVPFLTFMVAFAVMASGITSASTLARAFAGDYFGAFVELPIVLVAIVFIVVVAAINLRGISESVKVNVVLTVIEVAGLLFIVVIGVAALIEGGDADPARNFDFKEGSSVFLAIVGGTTLAFYALIGFEDSVNVAEEVQEPRRAFPRALFGGLLIAGILYLLVTLTASTVVPTEQLAASTGPLLEVVREGPFGVSPQIFAVIALLAVANGALINMVMASRLVYGLGRQGIVPAVFARLLPGRRTPIVAIIFTTAIAVVLISSGDIGELADTTVLLLLLVFTVVNVSVLVLRRDDAGGDHFRAPTIAPVLGALVSIFLITQTEAAIFLNAGILLAVGVLLWLVNYATTRQARTLDPEGLDAS